MSKRMESGDKLRRFVNREKQNLDLRCDASDFRCGLCAIHYRHVDIEHNDVGLKFDNSFDGFLAIFSLADYLKAVPIQKRADCSSSRQVVIYDKDFCWQFCTEQRALPAHAEREGTSRGGAMYFQISVPAIQSGKYLQLSVVVRSPSGIN